MLFQGRGPEILVTTFSIAKRGDTSRTYFLKTWIARVQFLLAVATEPLFVKISTAKLPISFRFDLWAASQATFKIERAILEMSRDGSSSRRFGFDFGSVAFRRGSFLRFLRRGL